MTTYKTNLTILLTKYSFFCWEQFGWYNRCNSFLSIFYKNPEFERLTLPMLSGEGILGSSSLRNPAGREGGKYPDINWFVAKRQLKIPPFPLQPS